MGDEKIESFKFLSHMISHVFNEQVLLNLYEANHTESQFNELHTNIDKTNFDSLINSAITHMGGPPEFYLVSEDYSDPLPSPDTYPEAVMREVFDVYTLARKSVIRTHMFLSGSSMIISNPDLIADTVKNEELIPHIINGLENIFWENAETAYIRLYAYWDRIGQVLDFSFFNIRKFDQNGFNSVMNRVHANAVPMNEKMRNSDSWKRLRAYQTSERETGLGWLLQRRNIICHSLHLHKLPESQNVFNSQFNHLENAHRDRLRPKNPDEEALTLIKQLNKAATLFVDFLKIIEFSSSRKKNDLII